MNITRILALLATLAAAGAEETATAPAGDGAAVVRDVYSAGKDEAIATMAGQPIYWSDLARYLIRSWGTSAAWGHANQLTYTELLRQHLDQYGLAVTEEDVAVELIRAWHNSVDGDPQYSTADTFEEYMRRVMVQTGKGLDAFGKFNWGYAAQSKIVNHLWSEADRLAIYEQGEDPGMRPGYTIAHILSQTLADKHGREEALARIEGVQERLAAGEDWNALCWEFSDDFRSITESAPRPEAGATATLLGLLPEFRAGECPFGAEVSLTAAALLQPGDVSDVVESDWGFHLLKLVSVRPRPSYAEIAGRIHGLLSGKLMTRIRAEADIVVHALGDEDWKLEPYAGEDTVVATVNGKPLMLSDFGRMLYLNAGPREGTRYIARMLEDFAVKQEAASRGITVSDDEVEAELQRQLEQATAGTGSPGTATPAEKAAALERWLTQRGASSHCSPSQYRIHQRSMLLHEKVAAQRASPENVRRYFDEHPSEFQAVYDVRAIILFHYDKRRTSEEANLLAEDIFAKLERARAALPPERLAGASEEYFKVLVERYSEYTITKLRGGVFNPFSPGVGGQPGTSGQGLAYEVAVEKAGLRGAGIAPVHGGVAIFEVIGHKPAPTFEEAAPGIAAKLRAHAASLAMREYEYTVVTQLLGIKE